MKSPPASSFALYNPVKYSTAVSLSCCWSVIQSPSSVCSASTLFLFHWIRVDRWKILVLRSPLCKHCILDFWCHTISSCNNTSYHVTFICLSNFSGEADGPFAEIFYTPPAFFSVFLYTSCVPLLQLHWKLLHGFLQLSTPWPICLSEARELMEPSSLKLKWTFA